MKGIHSKPHSLPVLHKDGRRKPWLRFHRILLSVSLPVLSALCVIAMPGFRSTGRAEAGTVLFTLQQAAPAPGQKIPDAPERKPEPADQGRNSQNPIVATPEDYRIGISDVLDITIEDAPELSGMYTVSSAGTILLPYLERVEVGRKTPEEVSRSIADGLRGRYLKNPRVTTIVKQYNSRAFFIQGAVRTPGVYQVQGTPSLLKLITIAGGLAENHGSTAFIIRENNGDPASGSASQGEPDPPAAKPEYVMVTASIGGLLKGNFELNVKLEPGDIVNIPPSDVFFVAGEVRAAGSFPLKTGTTLRQAISLAQGTTTRAALSRGLIFREDSNGRRDEIRVDIGAVMSGKKQDIPLLANDIVIVPNSRMKSIGTTLLSAFGTNVVMRSPFY